MCYEVVIVELKKFLRLLPTPVRRIPNMYFISHQAGPATFPQSPRLPTSTRCCPATRTPWTERTPSTPSTAPVRTTWSTSRRATSVPWPSSWPTPRCWQPTPCFCLRCVLIFCHHSDCTPYKFPHLIPLMCLHSCLSLIEFYPLPI